MIFSPFVMFYKIERKKVYFCNDSNKSITSIGNSEEDKIDEWSNDENLGIPNKIWLLVIQKSTIVFPECWKWSSFNKNDSPVQNKTKNLLRIPPW